MRLSRLQIKLFSIWGKKKKKKQENAKKKLKKKKEISTVGVWLRSRVPAL
jgi:hypothetical protein